MLVRGLVSFTCCAGLVLAAGLNNSDKQFLIMAARADMTEAHEGQMAESQAKRADVKDLAKQLVQDHTESYERLTQLAANKRVSIPKGIDAAKNPAIVQLAHLKDEHFDHRFSVDEVTSHKQALAAFKREAAMGRDADVKAFAANAIPVLEKHLQTAEACAKQKSS